MTPKPPKGYELFKGPHKWQVLPKGSKLWLPEFRRWLKPSMRVCAIPGRDFYYAVPKENWLTNFVDWCKALTPNKPN